MLTHPPVGQTRRPRHARGRHRRLPLLHHLDPAYGLFRSHLQLTFDPSSLTSSVALRRR